MTAVRRHSAVLVHFPGIDHGGAFANYTIFAMGLSLIHIFPEINYDQIEKVRGMDIVFVTTAKTDEEAREFLRLLGMPFAN